MFSSISNILYHGKEKIGEYMVHIVNNKSQIWKLLN